MEKMTFERAKEAYQNDVYAQAIKELGINLDALTQLLINKEIINEEEYDEYVEIVKGIVEGAIDKKIRKKVDEFNKDMQDPKKQVETMFKSLFY